METRQRIAVAVLSFSATALTALFVKEGFDEKATIPTKGDKPTVGHGSTVWEDGTPVKLGETITRERAVVLAKTHISKDEAVFRASLPGVKLHQAEYDIYMDWVYQYGTANWQKSSMKKHLLAGEYRQACDALLLWRKAAGYDCSTTINGQPNKRCWGSWLRQLERHKKCVEAQ